MIKMNEKLGSITLICNLVSQFKFNNKSLQRSQIQQGDNIKIILTYIWLRTF
jgi:hypothetical protein